MWIKTAKKDTLPKEITVDMKEAEVFPESQTQWLNNGRLPLLAGNDGNMKNWLVPTSQVTKSV